MNQRLSMWVALRCKESLFQQFMQVTSEPAAIEAVRHACEVQSRSELDSDPAAAFRFHSRIRQPFIEFSAHHQEIALCLN